MKVSVTALGTRAGGLRGAATAAVDYVCAANPATPTLLDSSTPAGEEPGPAAYFADASVEGPGRWLGAGGALVGVGGMVEREDLAALLAGEHPRTGQPLLDARGSAVRAAQGRTPASGVRLDGDPDELLPIGQLARLSGLDARYLRRLASRTHDRARQPEPSSVRQSRGARRAYLVAQRDAKGHWMLTRREALRFLKSRTAPSALIGYDVTFSVAKSVSILWATSQPGERDAIITALHAAVDAGLAYLEDAGCRVGRGASREPGRGFTAAAFTHGTSRNLDPQLHEHVLIANLAHTTDGRVRALDGTALFAHAKTAAHLAGAMLRHELTTRLGVAWGPVHNGVAEVTGVPRAAIDAMSTRSAEIDSLARELGADTPHGRQVAALRTRAPKRGVDPQTLRLAWGERLDATGFDAPARARCLDRVSEIPLVTEPDRARLFRTLARLDGITRHSATFDRRDVVQAVADWAANRLDTTEIQDLADEYLASGHVVPLAARADWRPGDLIRRRDGHAIPAAPELRIYSTPAMLHAERRVLDAFTTGHDRHIAVVPAAVLDHAVSAQQPALGADQRRLVDALCSSGDQFQCAIGPPGTGKTYALTAAARAWTDTGHRVQGLAVQGTAAENLGREAGIDAETVAAFLTRIEHSAVPIIDASSVVVVDEASTLPTVDFARLVDAVERAGAKAVFVGDPAQHGAVAAGGAFRALTARHAERTPRLRTHRRQAGPAMAPVRAALADLRAGRPTDALQRLDDDARILEADDTNTALTALVHDWHQDRLTRRADPTRAVSCMITEHHSTRRQLIARARALLADTGELHGPTLAVRGLEFQAGDEIICRARARRLHPPGRRGLYLRNGTLGVITQVRCPSDNDRGGLIVDFAHRGPLFVPTSELERELRPGIHGLLTHAYALTSHAAQGATFETARALITNATSRPALYVSASRGRSDLRLYLVNHDRLLDDTHGPPELPRHDDGRATLDTFVVRLAADRAETLASIIDPQATELSALIGTHDLPAINRAQHGEPPDSPTGAVLRRAHSVLATTIATGAIARPGPDVIAHLDTRPDAGHPARAAWDHAVSAIALYRTQHELAPLPANHPDWPIGPRPSEARAATQHTALLQALQDARAQVAACQPTPQLTSRRTELLEALGRLPANPTTLHTRVTDRLDRARHHCSKTADGLATATRTHQTLNATTGRHRDEQAIERARRHLSETAAAHERARIALGELEHRLGALDRDDDSLRTLQTELAVIDAALDCQLVASGRDDPRQAAPGHAPPAPNRVSTNHQIEPPHTELC